LDQAAIRDEKEHVEELRPESFVVNFLQKRAKKDDTASEDKTKK
jgi:hypothetical protein